MLHLCGTRDQGAYAVNVGAVRLIIRLGFGGRNHTYTYKLEL